MSSENDSEKVALGLAFLVAIGVTATLALSEDFMNNKSLKGKGALVAAAVCSIGGFLKCSWDLGIFEDPHSH